MSKTEFIGALAVWLGAAGLTHAWAEVLYLDNASYAGTDAVASAGGAAHAAGYEGRTNVWTNVSTLATIAADAQRVTSQFGSPSMATFTFTGNADAASWGDAFTRMLSDPTTTLTVVSSKDVSTTTAKGATTTDKTMTTSRTVTGPTTVTTTKGSGSDSKAVVAGYAKVEASAETASDFMFKITGDTHETLALQYSTIDSNLANLSSAVGYQTELVDDTTGGLVGAPDWVGSNATGEDLSNIAASGVYSLVIGKIPEVSGTVFADEPSQGLFQMSITPVPELPTWGLLLIGLAGLGSVRLLQTRKHRDPAAIA